MWWFSLLSLRGFPESSMASTQMSGAWASLSWRLVGHCTFFFFFILNIAFSFGQNRIRCMPVCSSWMTTCVSKEAFNFSVPFLLSCLPTDIIDFPSVSDYKCLSAAQQMMQASASALFVNSVWYYYNYNSYGWLGVRIIDMVFSWWRWTSIALVPVGLVTLSLAVDMYI